VCMCTTLPAPSGISCVLSHGVQQNRIIDTIQKRKGEGPLRGRGLRSMLRSIGSGLRSMLRFDSILY